MDGDRWYYEGRGPEIVSQWLAEPSVRVSRSRGKERRTEGLSEQWCYGSTLELETSLCLDPS